MKKYTDQQLKAIEDQNEKFGLLLSFLDEGKRTMGIFGPAGVGKTHMVERIIRELSLRFRKEMGRVPRILCAAISHQACGVLEMSMASISGIEYDVKTLASSLHLERKISEEGYEVFVYKEKRKWVNKKWVVIPTPVAQCDILVVDECSQLDHKQITQINSAISPSAYQFYLGDICQLPPIDRKPNEKHSPIFNIPNVTLSIPFRYEGDIQILADAARAEILKGIADEPFDFDFWKKFVNHQNKDYVFTQDKHFFLKEIIDYNKDNMNPYRIKFICYKNYTIDRTSAYIRGYLNPNRFDYETGDLIRATNTFCPDGNRNILVNSEHGVIEKKRKSTANVVFVNHFGALHYWGIDRFTPETELIEMVESFTGLSVVIKKLDYFSIKLADKPDWIPISPVNPKEFTQWGQDILSNLYYNREEFDNNKWIAYYDLMGFFAQIAYGYGNNSHTAQGLSIEVVGIHLSDILSTEKATKLERLQSFYVALTRAMYKIIVYYE